MLTHSKVHKIEALLDKSFSIDMLRPIQYRDFEFTFENDKNWEFTPFVVLNTDLDIAHKIYTAFFKNTNFIFSLEFTAVYRCSNGKLSADIGYMYFENGNEFKCTFSEYMSLIKSKFPAIDSSIIKLVVQEYGPDEYRRLSSMETLNKINSILCA